MTRTFVQRARNTRLLTVAGVYAIASTGLAASASEAVSWRLGAMVLVLSGLLGAAFFLAYVVERYGFPFLEWTSQLARQWLQRRDDRVSLSARSVLENIGPELPFVVVLATAVIGGTWLFLGILEDVDTGDPLVAADRSVFQLLQALRSPAADAVLVAITEFGDRFVIVTVMSVALLFLVIFRLWWAAIYFMVAILGSSLFVYGLKWVLHRPRPMALYDGVSEFSFPSGHATTSMVVFGFLAILLGHSAPPTLRRALSTSALALILLIAFSRIYLGAHWLSDVAAGLSFGLAWIAGLAIAYFRQERRALPAPLLSCAIALALLAAGAWHISASHSADMARYAAHPGVNQAP